MVTILWDHAATLSLVVCDLLNVVKWVCLELGLRSCEYDLALRVCCSDVNKTQFLTPRPPEVHKGAWRV